MKGCSSTAKVLTAAGQPSGLEDFVLVDQEPGYADSTKSYNVPGTYMLRVTSTCTISTAGVKPRWDATVLD